MLSREDIREVVASVYPTKEWKRRVAKMTPAELLEIVLQLRKEGKL